MEWAGYLVATVFCLLGVGCLLLVVLSLPGIWVLLGLAAVIEVVDVYYLSTPHTFGWWLIGGCAALALVGEALEMAAGAAGTKAGGGTKRGMWGAVIGGFVGAIVFTPVIPIPVIGTLLGALIGTFTGAFLAENTRKPVEGEEKKEVKADVKAAAGATVGRLLGTMGKTAIAVALWLALSVAAFWP